MSAGQDKPKDLQEEILAGISEQELHTKPSVFKLITPFILTGLIFWWIFSGVNFQQVLDSLGSVDIWQVIGVVAAFCFFFVVMDVLSFGAGLKIFVEPQAPWRHICFLRGGTIFLGVLFPPLGEVAAPLYFVRHWQRPILRTVGVAFFVVFIDGFCGTTIISLAFLLFDTSDINHIWFFIIAGHWTLGFIVLMFCAGPLRKKVSATLMEGEFLHAFFNASRWQVLAIYGVRMLAFIAVCATLYYLLVVMGIKMSNAQAFLFMPIFMGSVFLPISAGGYGGPQGAAVLFLDQFWQVATTEQALAFSLLWSTFFLVGRTAIGGSLAIPFWFVLQSAKSKENR